MDSNTSCHLAGSSLTQFWLWPVSILIFLAYPYQTYAKDYGQVSSDSFNHPQCPADHTSQFDIVSGMF